MSYIVFERFPKYCDSWYSRHLEILESEIRAIKAFCLKGLGLDLGVSTEIFASMMKVQVGMDFQVDVINKKLGGKQHKPPIPSNYKPPLDFWEER